MDESEEQTDKTKANNNRKAKAQTSARLAKALEEAESLFSTNTPSANKIRKKPQKSHIEIRRDNEGNRIYHCPRKGSRRMKAVVESTSMADDMDDLPSPTAEQPSNKEINYQEQLASILDDCDEICSEMYGDCQEPEPMSQWQKRTKSSDANWENWRDNLFSSLLNSCVIPEDEFICMACGNETAVVKCSECISQYMCPTCDDTVHSDKPLHDRQEWLNGFYHYLKPTESVSREGIIMVKERYCPLICDTQCRSCGEGQLRKCVAKDKIILVTMKGRYDLHWFSLVCEACNVVQPLSLTSIINNGYWPGSPCQVNYLFDQEVFRVWETFKMRMPGSSESAFIKALEDISAVKGRTGIINASTFRKAAAEWRYCQYEVDKLQGITYIDCPPCSMSQHSAHVDGNQKLYRFKSVPRGNRTSYYGDLFIKNNTDVDMQIAEVYSTGKKEVGSNACGDSHWKAAKAVSKSKKKQDETGLEVACCRHSIAQAAVNMFRGEIYGYAHYLHTQYLLPRHVKFLWQDVICLYWPWAVSNTPRRLLKALDMAPALSVMHGKSHSWNCQFTWGGRWQDGAANGTGEEAEQVNSYISRLGSTTKRMSAAGREEALTEHVLGWNKRKVLNMPKYLRMRYAKTAKTLKEKQKELEETLVDFGLQGKEEKEILEGKSTVENFARADGKSEQEYGDAENYFILYHQIRDATLLKSFVEGGDRQTRDLLGNVELHSTVESKTSQLCSLQQQLSKIKEKFQQVSEEKLLEKGREELILKSILKLERKAEIIYFSIQRRARDISKVADRSKMRSSMRKKMSNERKNLKAVVDKLNAFGRSSVSLEEVLEGDFPWSDSDKEKAFDSIPIRTKASIVDKFVAVQRLTEEQDLLIGEMVNFMAYYRDNVLSELDTQQKGIKEMIESILNPDLIEEERVAQGLPEIDVKRYQIRRETISTLKGKLAMCNAGTWFAKLQLQNGMRNFRDLENVELQQYEDVDAEEEAEVSEGESSSDDEENKMDE